MRVVVVGSHGNWDDPPRWFPRHLPTAVQKHPRTLPAKAGLLAAFEAAGRSGSSSAGKVGGVRGEEEDALAERVIETVFVFSRKASFDTLFWGGMTAWTSKTSKSKTYHPKHGAEKCW